MCSIFIAGPPPAGVQTPVSVGDGPFRFDPAKSQILVVDGQDAGVASVEQRAEEYFVASIAVAPSWQRRGLGTAVIRDVQAQAAHERKPVRLQVLKVNPARRLYERLGFAVTSETVTHYQLLSSVAAVGGKEEGQR